MMKKTRYPIDQCALYKCSSRKRLASVLKIELNQIRLIHEYINYHKFEINKNDKGEKRQISAPSKELKRIQKRILRLIQFIERPEWLISGEKGKSYIDNAKYHRHSHYALTMDIKSFYNNCKREYVFQFFHQHLVMPNDIAALITDIVTFNGGIPTGSPTSQLIAYYAYENMFFEVNSLASSFGCLFTLYVDDMSFSSIEPFEYLKLAQGVDVILRKYGHKPKYSKVKYFGKNDLKTYTGVVTDGNGNFYIPNKSQKNIYDNFQIVKNKKTISRADKENFKKILTLSGQLNAAHLIDSKKFPEITRLTKSIKIKD